MGRVVAPFGRKGEVKIVPESKDPINLLSLNVLFFKIKSKYVEMKILHAKKHKKFVLLKIEGIDDIDAAEDFRECGVFCREEELLSCGNDEYYHKDLLECKVVDKNGAEIGELESIIENPGNDILQIRMDKGEELLVPFVTRFVSSVNLDKKVIVIENMQELASSEE